MNFKEKERAVLSAFIGTKPSLQMICLNLGDGFSKTTVYRILRNLRDEGLVTPKGSGKNTRYELSDLGKLILPVSSEKYFAREQDKRFAVVPFHFEVFDALEKTDLLDSAELRSLYDRQREFEIRINALSPALRQKEMERLAIDLSWKSSQIEGNTYSLLQTEALFKESKTAYGKSKEETLMLLNHKEALRYILEQPDYFENLTVRKIEEVHFLLIKDLGVHSGIRTQQVGITGTNYRPLDNEFQIREAMERLCGVVNSKKNALEKALLLLLLIAYIQPFEDGNKRTSRIIANAALLANQYCPVSFRTMEPEDYRYAIILFYELNSAAAFKEIFIEQFKFSASNYF